MTRQGDAAPGPVAAERTTSLAALADDLLRRRRDRSARPTVLGVDGRTASGKTTLAGRLAALVPHSVVVHTDDVAWHHSFFDWTDLLREGVLLPARGLAEVAYRPPGWVAKGREGAVRVPAGTRVIVVEGVGATRRELTDLLDAGVWVQTDAASRDEREAARIAAGTTDADLSREWLAAEETFLAGQRPWERVDVVVVGDPRSAVGPEIGRAHV